MVACQYITGDNTTKWHQLENFHSLKNAGRKVSDLRPEACCQVCPIKVDTGHSKAEPPETIKQRTKERVTECETESEQGRAKTTTHTKTQSPVGLPRRTEELQYCGFSWSWNSCLLFWIRLDYFGLIQKRLIRCILPNFELFLSFSISCNRSLD